MRWDLLIYTCFAIRRNINDFNFFYEFKFIRLHSWKKSPDGLLDLKLLYVVCIYQSSRVDISWNIRHWQMPNSKEDSYTTYNAYCNRNRLVMLRNPVTYHPEPVSVLSKWNCRGNPIGSTCWCIGAQWRPHRNITWNQSLMPKSWLLILKIFGVSYYL